MARQAVCLTHGLHRVPQLKVTHLFRLTFLLDQAMFVDHMCKRLTTC